MVIFKLIVNKIETVQEAITTFEDALFEGLERHLVGGDAADPDQAVLDVPGQEFGGALGRLDPDGDLEQQIHRTKYIPRVGN